MHRYIALKKVITTGSFSKAAAELGYTQSAVSQLVSSLEKDLSFKLLVRSRDGIVLTPEGTELLPYIDNAVSQYKKMKAKEKELASMRLNHVNMGAFASIASSWLPEAIKEYRKTYSNTNFSVICGDSSEIEEWILEGKIDFALSTPLNSALLQSRLIYEEQLYAVLPPQHALAAKDTVTLQELAALPLVLLRNNETYEPNEAFIKAGIKVNIPYIIQNDHALLKMIETGLGVSIVSESLIKGTKCNIAVRKIDQPITRRIEASFKTRKSLNPEALKFIEFIQTNELFK